MGDRLIEMENVAGSRHDDLLFGDPGANRLVDAGSDDRLRGREGNDALEGESGADTFAPRGGRDR